MNAKSLQIVFWPALAYFTAIFAFGFGFGTLRVLLIAPAIGQVPAIAIELPLILGLSWVVAGRLPRYYQTAFVSGGNRLRIGALALALLMLAEIALAALVFGQPLTAYLSNLATSAGLLGLAGQIGFALIPWLRRG